MKGFVPTPRQAVDAMVELLFRDSPPTGDDFVLDPGCGTGEFIDGVIRWCEAWNRPLPNIVGVESDPGHMAALCAKFGEEPKVRIELRDYLVADARKYRYVIGNPPYVPITKLSEEEKDRYRNSYLTARGRFDLYLLFFEQALQNLADGGRLVFITPEKFLYVETAGPLRRLLAVHHVEEIQLAHEATFGDLVTYPTITVVNNASPSVTRFSGRDGSSSNVLLPAGKQSWLPLLSAPSGHSGERLLSDYCRRISCGIATGADSVYVRLASSLSPELRSFGRETLAGREIKSGDRGPESRFVMLVPYDELGRLLPEEHLGALGEFLGQPENKRQLEARTCARRKPWYAFHETPYLVDILRPKILCKDICESPQFVADYSGSILPRHSVYYIVPNDPGMIPAMLDYLSSESVLRWLESNSQRAAKGFFRMQSKTLQALPVPAEILDLPDAAILPSTPTRSLQKALPL